MKEELFFELLEPWQVYVFSKICEDLGIEYIFGRYVSDSKMIVAIVTENRCRIECLLETWEFILKNELKEEEEGGYVPHEQTLIEYLDECINSCLRKDHRYQKIVEKYKNRTEKITA